MKRLRHNRHGAVTVMVSMMLIPALLISGTAVDLARIHTAKGMAQNTNQLLLNAALSQYDALLKDLYGLFGVAQEDAVLGYMVDNYVKMSIYGEDPGDAWIQTGLGSFNTFAGSSASAMLSPIPGNNLRNKDILRRQIEEYMKYRGPVVLVERLLGEMDKSGPKIKAGNNVLVQQEVVNNVLSELVKMYIDYYYAIREADLCDSHDTFMKPGSPMPTLSLVYWAADAVDSTFLDIKAAFGEMESLYKRWETVSREIDMLTPASSEKEQDALSMYQAERNELRTAYEAQRGYIKALAEGGQSRGWIMGERVLKLVGMTYATYADGTPVFEWREGKYAPEETFPGLPSRIDAVKSAAGSFRSKFQAVVDIGASIDMKSGEALQEIARLEERLGDPNCDKNMAEPLLANAAKCKDMINSYPDLESHAKKYQQSGNAYLDKVIESYSAEFRYRDRYDP
ncbi:MAG: hypothetical protein LBH09_07555, partial [Peptococcaceae bacterium]|nr:hypothetical protein [Peptococcaceae bacterium]